MIELNQSGDVYVLTMTAGDNRMNDPWLTAINQALDEVERAPGPKALVTTGTGKFYSNGLDLDWLRSGEADTSAFIAGVERVFARFLSAPFITVAACNGHTFAAGAMLAMSHDFRIMREDRGFFCLPEVDIKIPLSAGMNSLMMSKLPHTTAHEVLVTGKRFGGVEAAEKGIVSEFAAEADVLPNAIEMARALADKDGPTVSTIRRRMYADTIELLSTSEGALLPPAG